MNQENKQENSQNELIASVMKVVAIATLGYFILSAFNPFGLFKEKRTNETVNNQTEEYNSDINEDAEIEEDEIYEDNIDEVFSIVEEMPKYKGCENLDGDEASQCTMLGIQKYIAKIDYPQIAMDNDIEGKVWMEFVVDKTGSVTDVKLLRGVDKLLDNAAIQHIKKMPRFASSGKQKGKPVTVTYKVPISFQLE